MLFLFEEFAFGRREMIAWASRGMIGSKSCNVWE